MILDVAGNPLMEFEYWATIIQDMSVITEAVFVTCSLAITVTYQAPPGITIVSELKPFLSSVCITTVNEGFLQLKFMYMMRFSWLKWHISVNLTNLC